MDASPVGSDPRRELAEVISQAEVYLTWLQDEGRAEVEIGFGGLPPTEAATAPVKPPAVASRPKPVAPRPAASAPPPAPKAEARVVSEPQGAPAAEARRPVAEVEAGLRKIAEEIERCTKCPLYKTRTHSVPGQGHPRPEIMFVGEAPGADEDEQGLAFVGRAGQLLTKMIQAMGFQREDVFIGNILKSRPPNNRQPLPEEMEACLPYLKAQIALLKPKVIVALGATAVRGLVGLDGITKLRGKWLAFEGIRLMPTYHPAYLLRNPPAKKDVWVDLQEVLRFLGRTPPPVKKTDA